MAKTIVIFSTKGGVGKTLIATNIAVSLARDEQQKVCLMDMDIGAVGDMGRMIDIIPSKSLSDLVHLMKHSPQQAQRDRRLFIDHSRFEVDFLAGVSKPQQYAHLDPTKIREVFDSSSIPWELSFFSHWSTRWYTNSPAWTSNLQSIPEYVFCLHWR